MHEIPRDAYQLGETCGKRAVWVSLLVEALQQLGYHEQSPEAVQQSWARERLGYIVEREEALALLRDICATWGDNDWSEQLALAEILDKHLLSHLERGMVNDG